MTEFEELILREVALLREEVGEVREVVRGWRGQLVKQAGLVGIALITALGQTCSGSEAAAPAAAHAAQGGAISESGEGGSGGQPAQP